MKTITLIATLLVVSSMAVGAGPFSISESFDSGFTGTAVGNHADWGPAGAGATPTAGSGVGGSVGLPQHGNIFTWTAHPFSWADDVSVGQAVISQMDFKTTASGTMLDDDRIGWMIRNDTTSSSYIFGVQADPGGSGAGGNIECYWDGTSFGDDDGRKSLADVPALNGQAWYRLRAEFTKLTNTSCSIDVSLAPVDGSGNAGAPVASGNLPDTAALPSGSTSENRPMEAYFKGYNDANVMWPGFKNYNSGFADNASFEVTPEPATMSLLALGGLALIRRKKR